MSEKGTKMMKYMKQLKYCLAIFVIAAVGSMALAQEVALGPGPRGTEIGNNCKGNNNYYHANTSSCGECVKAECSKEYPGTNSNDYRNCQTQGNKACAAGTNV